MSRFVRPEETRLEISHGDWLLVKKRLNKGEWTQAFERQMVPALEGWRVNPMLTGLVQVAAYLIDWSLAEYPIRGKSVDDVTAALNALDPDDFAEILAAIRTHEAAVQRERDLEKKTHTPNSDVTVISP